MFKRMLTPLAWIWRAGSAVQMSRARAARRKLDAPVISVGALTMGGAGKTPLVAHLAARLRALGWNPAILTRGYKRTSREPIVMVRRGQAAAVESTGDEAQIFIRRGDAHVGIGANRYEVGRAMEREFAPDIFLLDDGFQHVELHRDHDIVLIDSNDPEAGGAFPVGRLREPLSALRRATEVVLTGDGEFRTHLPCFRSRVIPLEWVSLESGAAMPLEAFRGQRVVAFCGLGNPRSFWRTLEQIGIAPLARREFPDHHRYSRGDLASLAAPLSQAADAYLTTEKDSINIGARCRGERCAKIFWLRIDVEIENEAELLERILD